MFLYLLLVDNKYKYVFTLRDSDQSGKSAMCTQGNPA